MEDRFIATFILHALGDTIGFYNGKWEFNYGFKDTDIRITLEIISEFIKLGGINGIDLKDWFVSDDTLLNYEIGKFMLNSSFDIAKLKNSIKKMYTIEQKNKNINRLFGITTLESIESWKNIDNKMDFDKIDFELFDEKSGGNGCAMRTLPIGLRFHKKEHLTYLIDMSIQTSFITHTSPLGYLSGMSIAYFTSLAISNVNPNLWCKLLLELLDSKEISKYMIRYEQENAYHNFIKTIKYYYDIFYDKNGVQVELKTKDNLIGRIKIFKDIEDFLLKLQKSDITITEPIASVVGSAGPTAVIMALQSLIDCDGKWEKLVFYSMLHGGDSDTVGAIAGGLYGATYGFGDVPKKLLENLEMKKELEEIGKELYILFQKSN
jgi:ADP-ribosylarginine hydrolase